MQIETQAALRAIAALQSAFLRWDADQSPSQGDARQALDDIREATNALEAAKAQAYLRTSKRRHQHQIATKEPSK